MPIFSVMNFLIVDDDSELRMTLRDMLEGLGAKRVWAVADGAKALERMRALDFGRNDVVLADWNMQPMTGLQFLQEVRADAKLKHIPFIMVTAESKTENVIAAKQAGVNNYIVKPFNAAVLKGKIATVLGDF